MGELGEGMGHIHDQCISRDLDGNVCGKLETVISIGVTTAGNVRPQERSRQKPNDHASAKGDDESIIQNARAPLVRNT